MRRIRKHLTPATALAGIALFVSLGGVSYAVATGSIDSREIKNNDVRAKDVRQGTLTGADMKPNGVGGGAIKESTLDEVPSAAQADAVSSIKLYAAKLAAGETKELLKHGPFTLTAVCVDNGTDNAGLPNRDAARILISTTEEGSVMSGADDLDGGPAPADFLNTTTVDTDRVFAENSVPNGDIDAGANGAEELGFASAPSGPTLEGARAHSLLGVNVFGSACAFSGYVITG